LVPLAGAKRGGKDARSDSGPLDEEENNRFPEPPPVFPVRRNALQTRYVDEEEDQGEAPIAVQLRTASGAILFTMSSATDGIPDEPVDDEEDEAEKLRFKTASGAISLAVPSAPVGVLEEPDEEEEDEAEKLRFKTSSGSVGLNIPQAPVGVPDEPDDDEEDGAISLILPSPSATEEEEPPVVLLPLAGDALRFKTPDGAISLIVRSPASTEEEEEPPIVPPPPAEEEYYRWSPATWVPPPAPGEPPHPLRLDPARPPAGPVNARGRRLVLDPPQIRSGTSTGRGQDPEQFGRQLRHPASDQCPPMDLVHLVCPAAAV
jgi:hypothetical protein